MRSATAPFANLREFCEFWADTATRTPCCLTADDELLETDPEQFDCETCPVAAHLDGLRPENREAWRIFRVLASRFLVDLSAGGLALDKLTSDLDAEQFEDLVQRLTVIYDVLAPPKASAGQS